ncbi:hypothetical protein [Natronomonas sp. CBA1123]|nr:hypothetical protein [Natronomonas sp. CBA1123]
MSVTLARYRCPTCTLIYEARRSAINCCPTGVSSEVEGDERE